MIKINVRADISGAIRKLKATREAVQVATPRALNKVAQQVRTQSAREIRAAGYKLKISTIKDAIKIQRATRSAPKAIVIARGGRVGLIEYAARQTSKGVTVSVKNGRKLIRSAFIATMPSGHRGVFQRTGLGRKRVTRNGRVRSSGLPIRELFGPGVNNAFANQIVRANLTRFARERFRIVFEQELRYAGLKRE